MKKKILFLMMVLTMSLSSFAQFEQGKAYLNASLSGLDLNFTGADKWKLDLTTRCGLMVEDNWMAMGVIEYNYRKHEPTSFAVGAGMRYHIVQNGLYLGVGAKFRHYSFDDESYSDFMPNFQMGYVFFLNETVTIEPEFYYDQSLKDHSNYSRAGIRLGVGIYLDNLF
ncbi:MAG: outer membrane beta-barrel protein [Prevotella sp.]|jgi:hypothetical protein|nr:outer membrane beta-barrel protein [Prevotella sp.]